MRSFLKIFVTAVVLACGFAGYLLYQPKSALQSSKSTPPSVQRLRANKGDALVGGGEAGWVRQFDDAGALSSRFRLQEWEQQENGLIHVIRPEAEFYFKGKGDARAKVVIQGV